MTQSQHRVALRHANEIKQARSRAKHELAEGRLTIRDALELECLQTMTVERLLTSQHRWGPKRAAGLLCSLEWKQMFISPRRPLGQLTDRERVAIAEACGPNTGRAAA